MNRGTITSHHSSNNVELSPSALAYSAIIFSALVCPRGLNFGDEPAPSNEPASAAASLNPRLTAALSPVAVDLSDPELPPITHIPSLPERRVYERSADEPPISFDGIRLPRADLVRPLASVERINSIVSEVDTSTNDGVSSIRNDSSHPPVVRGANSIVPSESPSSSEGWSLSGIWQKITHAFSSSLLRGTAVVFAAGAGILGFVGAFRGSAKLMIYLWALNEDRKNFEGRRCLSSPATNLHSFTVVDGRTIMDITTIDNPPWPKLFRDLYTPLVFQQALKMCTPENCFPCEFYEEAHRIVRGRLLPIVHKFLPFNSKTAKAEIDQTFREYLSELNAEGAVRNDLGKNSAREIYYGIGICEVSDERRDYVNAVIRDDNFEYFDDPAWVQALLRDNPDHKLRILQLQEAREKHWGHIEQRPIDPLREEFPEGHPRLREPGDTLFPWSRWFVKPLNGQRQYSETEANGNGETGGDKGNGRHNGNGHAVLKTNGRKSSNGNGSHHPSVGDADRRI